MFVRNPGRVHSAGSALCNKNIHFLCKEKHRWHPTPQFKSRRLLIGLLSCLPLLVSCDSREFEPETQNGSEGVNSNVISVQSLEQATSVANPTNTGQSVINGTASAEATSNLQDNQALQNDFLAAEEGEAISVQGDTVAPDSISQSTFNAEQNSSLFADLPEQAPSPLTDQFEQLQSPQQSIGIVLDAEPTVVAFVGDQGVNSSSQAVLQLIKDEGTDLLLIQGDLGYGDENAIAWESNLRNILGRNFPVLTVVGNHDDAEWPLYESFIKQRINRAEGLSCDGEAAIRARCTFRNIQVAQVAIGIDEVPGIEPEDNYDGFIAETFADSLFPWRICSWHKNQALMQLSVKEDETGWEVYNACLDAGAMITMGHAHVYTRTYILNDYETQSVEHFGNEMILEPGKSFSFVNGLGGRDVKPQTREPDAWFASVYTATQNATHGVLFCVLGDRIGECYFKDVNGAIPDRFTLRSRNGL